MDIPSALRRIPLRPVVWGFFLCTLALGIWGAKDYGISWDEKAMLVLGEEAYEYVAKGEPYPTHIGIRFHGAFVEIVLHALQELFHLRYARSVFIFRHAAAFVIYWGGMLALYALALRHFRHRGWALLVAVFYLLSPRQFGHSFVNTRDIPAMVFFIFKMCTLLVFLERKTVRSALAHGATSALVIALRVGGLFAPIFTMLFLGLEMLREYLERRAIAWKRYALLFCVYLFTYAIVTIALWPLLWEQPALRFYEAMHNMITSQQAPGGLYFGRMVGQTPWHWVPVHFITKTPSLYVLLFLVGACTVLAQVIRRPHTILSQQRSAVLFLAWFLIPILIVIVMKGDLFDEWRHMYFIYPAVLLLAAHGLRELLGVARSVAHPRWRRFLQGTLVVVPATFLLSTGAWMVRNHPLQYVYFSIPSRFVEHQFELDYWGLSYRQAFEWLLEHDPDAFITVTVTSSPGWENLNILTREQRRRLVLSKNYTSKYVLDNFDWANYEHTLPDEAKVHSITLSGMEILSIYRNPNWKPQTIDPGDIMETEKVQTWFDPRNMP